MPGPYLTGYSAPTKRRRGILAIIQRRVFHVKTGRANDVIAANQEFVELARGAGFANRHRVLTDYMSGRSDRVVSEIEAASVGEIEAAMGKMMSDPRVLARLGELQHKLESLVEYSEVEHFAIQGES